MAFGSGCNNCSLGPEWYAAFSKATDKYFLGTSHTLESHFPELSQIPYFGGVAWPLEWVKAFETVMLVPAKLGFSEFDAFGQ